MTEIVPQRPCSLLAGTKHDDVVKCHNGVSTGCYPPLVRTMNRSAEREECAGGKRRGWEVRLEGNMPPHGGDSSKAT